MKILLSILVLSIMLSSKPANAAQAFDIWLDTLRQEARQQGISENTIQAALTDIKPITRVIELDRKQPEGSMTFAQYYERVISAKRIKDGQKMYRKHRDLLERIAAEYGVPAQYIVALWGIETSYGAITGGFKVVPALATLAHDGRRSEFFRKELFNALKIIDQGHISAANMKGSWAGAMGQNQFMPSSFHSFAVDGNGDGKRDIWGSLPDVFASSANYLAKSGWIEEERWGRAVKLPEGFSEALEGRKIKKPLSFWKKLGITLPGGGALPSSPDLMASVIAPDGLNGPIYLVYNNFHVIMKWNKSTYFATSVGKLADQIKQ